MFSKRILLREVETGKKFHVVKTSYNLSALDDEKWYLDKSNELFSVDFNLLKQLDIVTSDGSLYDNDKKELYKVLTVGYPLAPN